MMQDNRQETDQDRGGRICQTSPYRLSRFWSSFLHPYHSCQFVGMMQNFESWAHPHSVVAACRILKITWCIFLPWCLMAVIWLLREQGDDVQFTTSKETERNQCGVFIIRTEVPHLSRTRKVRLWNSLCVFFKIMQLWPVPNMQELQWDHYNSNFLGAEQSKYLDMKDWSMDEYS